MVKWQDASAQAESQFHDLFRISGMEKSPYVSTCAAAAGRECHVVVDYECKVPQRTSLSACILDWHTIYIAKRNTLRGGSREKSAATCNKSTAQRKFAEHWAPRCERTECKWQFIAKTQTPPSFSCSYLGRSHVVTGPLRWRNEACGKRQ